MEFTRAELKASAKAQLKGNVWWLLLAGICGGLLAGASAGLAGIGEIFLGYPIIFGTCVCVYMDVARGNKTDLGKIFEPFKKFYWKSIGIIFLEALLIILWSCLLVIPGIIKCYSYSQALYILNDNPEKGVVECITESRMMMKGHKWELFVLELSFIPWMLLGAVTAGLAYIYVEPYMTLTFINYYFKLSGANDGKKPEAVETAAE